MNLKVIHKKFFYSIPLFASHAGIRYVGLKGIMLNVKIILGALLSFRIVMPLERNICLWLVYLGLGLRSMKEFNTSCDTESFTGYAPLICYRAVNYKKQIRSQAHRVYENRRKE